jgi:hypothetical protein
MAFSMSTEVDGDAGRRRTGNLLIMTTPSPVEQVIIIAWSSP